MFLNEQKQQWSNIIREEYGVQDKTKLDWISQYAMNHEIVEGLQVDGNAGHNGIYSTPMNTMGLGNPYSPSNFEPSAPVTNDLKAQTAGSGDIPMSTLSMSLTIAAVTIGLELVPVIPANGPWAMLSYMDFPYAGGKLGRINETSLDGKGAGADNKPIYIKLNLKGKKTVEGEDVIYSVTGEKGKKITIMTSATPDGEDDAKFIGSIIGNSYVDANIILKVEGAQSYVGENVKEASIAEVLNGRYVVDIDDATGAGIAKAEVKAAGVALVPELVDAVSQHVQGFSNFYDGSEDPMSRAQNETGIGNTIGARMFSKWVQMGAYEVTGSVTRQQLQDMPLYGVDVIGKVLEAMQNQITQEINNRILDRVFKLGEQNYDVQKDYQGVDLNIDLGDVTDTDSGLNNYQVRQRRIASHILGAANLIAQVGRRGRANWVVCSTAVATALQDSALFAIAPMTNTLTQDGSQSLFMCGSIAGLNVYVDPYMKWNDGRVCVGRKGDGNTPGVVFMPYILADKVQTIVEGTMAPKLLLNSRFAIVDAGFYPEQNYYTFNVTGIENAI